MGQVITILINDLKNDMKDIKILSSFKKQEETKYALMKICNQILDEEDKK